jgi:diphthamide synthase (EF-2-diphthine--ammonia ligase)
MFSSGLQAVLVKVAGVGLSVESVGKDLASMLPTFRKLVSDV